MPPASFHLLFSPFFFLISRHFSHSSLPVSYDLLFLLFCILLAYGTTYLEQMGLLLLCCIFCCRFFPFFDRVDGTYGGSRLLTFSRPYGYIRTPELSYDNILCRIGLLPYVWDSVGGIKCRSVMAAVLPRGILTVCGTTFLGLISISGTLYLEHKRLLLFLCCRCETTYLTINFFRISFLRQSTWTILTFH